MVTESASRQASTSRPAHLKGFARRAIGAILFSAVFALAIPAGRAAQADDPPLGIYIYAISRDGTPVGQQRMEFVRDGEKLRVISHMQVEVTLLGMTLFNFNQRAEEVRAGGNVVSLASDADDDGKTRQVSLTLEGDRLKGIYNKDAHRDVDPKWPTSLFWQKPATGATHVIDSVNGKLRDVTVTEVGPATLTLPVGRLQARHYRVTGDLERELWYDADGILVAGKRNGRDGSTVLLELQQRP
jgi:hypothetical protein